MGARTLLLPPRWGAWRGAGSKQANPSSTGRQGCGCSTVGRGKADPAPHATMATQGTSPQGAGDGSAASSQPC